MGLSGGSPACASPLPPPPASFVQPVPMACGCQVDWALIRLSGATDIRRLEVDTNHFKGNCPESCEILGAVVDLEGVPREEEAAACERASWSTVLPRTALTPHTQHHYSQAAGTLPPSAAATHVRLRIFPDGGVSRLRVWGVPAEFANSTSSKL